MRKSGNRESSVRFLSRGHAKFPMVAAKGLKHRGCRAVCPGAKGKMSSLFHVP